MKKIVIDTVNAPKAIGPYSQAIKVDNTIYISGQLGINPETGNFDSNDIKIQTKQSLENIKSILEEAGYFMSDVVKTTVLLKNIADFNDMNEVYAEYFTKPYPARAAFQVAALPKDGCVEIEVVAIK